MKRTMVRIHGAIAWLILAALPGFVGRNIDKLCLPHR
jgi:hypothetical protein